MNQLKRCGFVFIFIVCLIVFMGEISYAATDPSAIDPDGGEKVFIQRVAINGSLYHTAYWQCKKSGCQYFLGSNNYIKINEEHIGGTHKNGGRCTAVLRLGYSDTCGVVYQNHNTYVECSQKHCFEKVCSYPDCGVHKGVDTCNGGCDQLGECTHCSILYCSKCNDHICTHNIEGYCFKPHCSLRTYCSMCGHVCDGEHKFTTNCPKVHCNKLICYINGCNEHEDGLCGGGHTEGIWFTSGNEHRRYCGVSGCNVELSYSTHIPRWDAPNINHTSKCTSCTLTYTHTASWGEYFINGDIHSRLCTIMIGGSACAAIDSHSPQWSEYRKFDAGGEPSGASHLKRCLTPNCKITGFEHLWTDEAIWIAISETEHQRKCPTCNLTQTLDHNFVDRVAIDGNIEKHYKICMLCIDNNSREKYKLLEQHMDTEVEGRGNGVCDLCNKSLWRTYQSITIPTKEDVKLKVEIFSDNEDRIKLPIKMVDEFGNEFTNASGEYIVSKNGDYTFVFEAPDRDVIVTVDNISKRIYGMVQILPDTATVGAVKLQLITSKEGIDKTIDVRFEDEVWHLDTLTLEEEVLVNGVYNFYARDNLGNSEVFKVNVNNIVSGFGTVTNTYDVFKNGYIYTDILVNVTSEWVPSGDALMNCLNTAIYKTKVDSNTAPSLVKANKIQIVDEYGNVITSSRLTKGHYYLRVAIGGKDLSEEGTYMIEVIDVNVGNSDGKVVQFSGKNRIEVVVRSLNDLT